MQIIFNVKLPAKVKKQGRLYISCCPVLDVFSQGENKEKSLENLRQALKLFFLSCFERGTIDEVMKSCGFTPIERRVVKAKPFPKRYESINIPLPFQIPPKHGESPTWHD
jgi:predicted RNase H-like HicB family nuclease